MILIDTSVWIDHFCNGKTSDTIDYLIDNADICINDVIRAELLPMMIQRNERELEMMLTSLPCLRIFIDWNELITMQAHNLRYGINRVGLPDLMIAQNAMQNNVTLFSLDKHFSLMSEIMPIRMYTVSKLGC